MATGNITLSQARDDVSQIVRDDHRLALPLKRLLQGLVPDTSDPDLFSMADQLCRELTLLTPEFEEFYSEHCDCRGKVISLAQ